MDSTEPLQVEYINIHGRDNVRYSEKLIVETIIFCIKRIFSREYVTDIRFENMIEEIIMKASLYNWFQTIK